MSIDFNKSRLSNSSSSGSSLRLVDLATTTKRETAMTTKSAESENLYSSSSSRKVLDLIVELDYLGQVDVESKYLQVSIVPWLIGQIKLVDQDKQIRSVCLEINVKKNSFYVYKKAEAATSGFTTSSSMNAPPNELLNHRLTDMFKLTCLPHDSPYFGYFYRKNNTSFNYYTFHVFYSNKSNLSQVIIDFQTQALKVHDNMLYEKLFDFKLVTKMRTTQQQLNIPNFIEICLDKLIKSSKGTSTSKNKHHTTTTTTVVMAEKNSRVMLKFGTTRLFIQELDKEPIERDYKHVLYLNNSITNENYFCLAYSTPSSSSNSTNEPTVDAMILYSKNVELIDDVIREYAINVSSELSNADLPAQTTPISEAHYNNTNDATRSQQQQYQQQHTCLYCPMQQFINLCEHVYQKTSEFTYDVIIDKLNYNLDNADQNYLFGLVDEFKIDVDFKSSEQNLSDVNLFLMALLHKLCLKKQGQHLIDVQNKQTSHKFNFNLMLVKHSSPYSPRWNKNAKSSSSLSSPLARSNTIHTTPRSVVQSKKNSVLTRITGMMRPSIRSMSSTNGFLSPSSSSNLAMIHGGKMPTRKAIFNKIVAGGSYSGSSMSNNASGGDGSSSDVLYKKKFQSSQEIRRLWKKAISEQIILLKMLKDNQCMHLSTSSQQTAEHEFRRQESNNYAEITPCLKEAALMWDRQFSQSSSNTEQLLELVLKGVPREMRERVWIWLNKNHKYNESNKSPSGEFESVAYSELVRQTTIHQHAILLDLGRTFPSHVNFECKFGPGQQALFNVLKSYSIYDHEVGYCQGMSFIVGILLIHSNNAEESAFSLLKHLMVNLDFRQQYKPDMVQLQRYMYQFSRLVEARLPDLFTHFELNDVTSSLYAAPWFLTLYSSQFQIGFVARVFDFVFVEGVMALFRISLAILHVHKPILLSCDSFESIVNHLKTDIPEMSLIECELIISKAYSQAPGSLSHNLSKDLQVYEIEFNILYEEYANLMSLNNNSGSSLSSSSSNSQPALSRGNESGFDTCDTGGGESMSSISVDQLKAENSRLRRESKELRESLHSLQLQLFNSDEQFFKLFNENKQLKCKIDSLEIERNSCLKKVNDQEKLIRSFQMNINNKSLDDNH